MAKRTESERFMSHVEKLEFGCWLWTAFKMKSGYGNFRTPSRHELAHRASYRLFVGDLGEGMDVMHKCDRPWCVNPEHLILGTRTDNMRDAKAKNRTAVGSGHGRSRLKESDIKGIIQSPMKQREIADIYGVSQGHISAIRQGKRWAYLAKENGHR